MPPLLFQDVLLDGLELEHDVPRVGVWLLARLAPDASYTDNVLKIDPRKKSENWCVPCKVSTA